MNKTCVSWFSGLIEGDGYIDDRHVELYNSSESLLLRSINFLRDQEIPNKRIKVDIYSHNLNGDLISIWSRKMNLSKENFKMRKNTSPWKSRTEKIRLRLASKDFACKISKEINNPKNKKRYVVGLFDAEASVDIKGYIEFKQVDTDKGINTVQKVFQIIKQNNVRATDPRCKNDRNIKRDVYFYVKDIDRYSRLFGFFDVEKKRKLEIIKKAKKINNKPNLTQLKKLIADGRNLWEIIDELKSPYHRVRELIKRNHLAIR